MVVRKLGSRYLVFDEIASGGMANVHYGVACGQGGFQRIVAIKRLHESWAKDPEFSALFLDEAKMTSRVRHPNVVSMLDVVEAARELFIVMEYVAGAPLSHLSRLAQAQNERVPLDVAASIVAGVLSGLHAAHEATNDRGEPLEIVHRDVSPQNILVGSDGLAKIVDFGIAKAAGRSTTTRDGKLKGKLGYMAPEQLLGQPATRKSDIWSASVVLWELLVGRRLFTGGSEGEVVAKVAHQRAPHPRELVPDVHHELEAVVMRGLARNPEKRFSTAREMALALEEAVGLASAARVGAWVERLAADSLAQRALRVGAIEVEAATQLAEPVSESAPTSVLLDPETRSRDSKRGPRPLVALVVVTVAALVVGAAFFYTRPEAPGLVVAPLAATVSVPREVVPSALRVAASPPTSASVPPAVTRATVPVKPKAQRTSPATGARSPNCYRQDAEGIWHIKPECL